MREILQPLFTITLPLVLAIFVAAWLHNKHFDALSNQINDLSRRLDELRAEIMMILRDIQAQLKDLDRRVTRLEERTPPLVRG